MTARRDEDPGAARIWEPDQRLTRSVEQYLDGLRESQEEPEWGEFLRTVRSEGGWEVDDDGLRAAVDRHALLVTLMRSGAPGLDARVAQRIAARFDSAASVQEADPETLAEIAPELSPEALRRLQDSVGGGA
ncbi:MAG: hypothetical protein R3E98_00650 [Gemmatimonadota bacterium]|nr:hypothetical protein [Gemmatimonadota bacterium]